MFHFLDEWLKWTFLGTTSGTVTSGFSELIRLWKKAKEAF